MVHSRVNVFHSVSRCRYREVSVGPRRDDFGPDRGSVRPVWVAFTRVRGTVRSAGGCGSGTVRSGWGIVRASSGREPTAARRPENNLGSGRTCPGRARSRVRRDPTTCGRAATRPRLGLTTSGRVSSTARSVSPKWGSAPPSRWHGATTPGRPFSRWGPRVAQLGGRGSRSRQAGVTGR